MLKDFSCQTFAIYFPSMMIYKLLFWTTSLKKEQNEHMTGIKCAIDYDKYHQSLLKVILTKAILCSMIIRDSLTITLNNKNHCILTERNKINCPPLLLRAVKLQKTVRRLKKEIKVQPKKWKSTEKLSRSACHFIAVFVN